MADCGFRMWENTHHLSVIYIRNPQSAIRNLFFYPPMQLLFEKRVVPSWDRRGGRAIKQYRRRHPLIGTDGVVSQTITRQQQQSQEMR